MKSKIQKKIDKYFKKYKKNKKRYNILIALALIVALVTTYFLIRPGITLEEKIYWTKLTDISEVTSDGIYVILDSNDTSALTVSDTTFSGSTVTVTEKGTQNNKKYYDITGNNFGVNSQWKFSANGGNNTQMYSYGDSTKYVRHTTYYDPTFIVASNKASSNIIVQKTNNNFQVVRDSQNTTGTVYYISYTGSSFTIISTNNNTTYLNLYKQTIVMEEEEPDEPDNPNPPVSGDYWVKLQSTDELTTDDVYMFVDANNNASITYSTSSTSFTSGSITVTEAGTTDNGQKYYNITGDGSTANSQWKITSNSTVDTIYNNATNNIYIRLSTYNDGTHFVDINNSTLSNSSATNIAIQSAGNNLWYLTRLSSRTGTGTYYVTYSNNTFSVIVGTDNNSPLNVYRKVTIEAPEEPDKPPVQKIEKWFLVTSPDDITADDTYIIGYYNDSAYTDYNSNYMQVNDSGNIARGEITFVEDGNEDGRTYYKTENATDNFRWKFNTNTTGGTIQSEFNDQYLYFNNGNLTLSPTNKTTTTIEWNTENYWLIHSTVNSQDYYLKYNVNNSYNFSIATGTGYRAMKIYKLYVEEIEEPDDPTNPPIEEDITGDEADSGKIITDKSVSYNDSANIFSVSLSALGQDYNITNELNLNTNLLDVVFVLDASQYPLQIRYTGSTNGVNATNCQATAYVSAINQTITAINNLNPDNRVGVVLFNQSASTLLPLDKYTASDNTYISVNRTSTTAATYSTGTNIKKNNETYSNTASTSSGRYTQIGISTGAGLLTNAQTTQDYNLTFNYRDGSSETVTKTVQRKPVLILLTDGLPTYGTTTYNGPTTGNRQGTRTEGTNNTNRNNQGTYTYNTVRTLKYYKNQIETHYFGSTSNEYKTKFYTILTPSSTNNSSTNYGLSNTYAGFLEPNYANVNPLSTTDGYFSNGFKNGMTGDQNYTSNNNYYLYNDEYYRNNNWTANGLATTMNGYLPTEKPQEFGLKLKDNLTITDYIGEGMEVKGEPKLVYGGKTYNSSSSTTNGNTTTYHFTGTYTNSSANNYSVDLSTITAEVTTDNNNLQTVRLIVPDYSIPVYHTALSKSESPISLKFDVGLNSTAQNDVRYQTHGELTYYTNKWDDVTAHADYITTTKNPYFSNIKADQTKPKITPTDNLLTTADYSWKLPANNLNIQYLGNNGKLTYVVESVDVNIQTTWTGTPPGTDTTLYAYVKENDTISPLLDKHGSQYSITLSPNSNWNGTIYYLPKPTEGQTYYLIENSIDGYIISYDDDENISIYNENIKAGKLTFNENNIANITVINTAGVLLPATGGCGTTIIYIIGSIILLISIVSILTNKKTFNEN